MSGVLPQIEEIEKAQHRAVPLTEFRTGDTVRVHYQIVEGEKSRVQVFQGVVIRTQGKKGHARATFTVRKVSYNIGVERTFLYNSPRLQQIDVLSPGKVRQSRLYYMRGRRGKSARIAERQTFRPDASSQAPEPEDAGEEPVEGSEDAAEE
jgi:large subunit ribosomal protein L19